MFGGSDMRKEIVGVFVCMLLLTTTFSVMAGDEINPEITDEEGDARDYLDIVSAWFYEEPDNPDYLYIAIKIKDLSGGFLGRGYSIHWNLNDIVYASGLDVYGFRGQKLWRSGEYGRGSVWEWRKMSTVQGSYGEEIGIITWEIPKSDIGNPQPGDILTDTCAYSCQFGIIPALSFLSMFKGFRDWTYEYGAEYGQDYVIKY